MDSILDEWLKLLCRMLPGVKSAVAFCELDKEQASHFPATEPASPALLDAAKLAESQQSSLVIDQTAGSIYAIPIPFERSRSGAVAILVESDSDQQETIKHLINWGISWLELLLAQTAPGISSEASKVLPMVQSLAQLTKSEAEKSLVTQLANLFSADRVSLGLATRNGVELVALSHRPTFDVRVNLAGMIQSAMQEAITHGETINRGVTATEHTAHELLRQFASKSLLTIPLAGSEEVGALMLEREKPFSDQERKSAQDIAGLVTPRLEYQRLVNQGPAQYLATMITDWAANKVGQVNTARKLFPIAAVTVFLILLGTLDSSYKVGSKAILEGLSQQSVAAPFDGFIQSANARAGDIVDENELLATLDDRDILLELTQLENERDDFNRQYRQALADLDQPQSTILKARVEQADARLAQLHRKLQQIELRAPMPGVIISGDLSRALGAPLVKGDVLFEVAPLDAYRVVLHINERDIDDIQSGQSGLVTFSSHPDTKIPFEIDSVTSVMSSDTGEGVVFRTEANILADHLFLRPGMEGYAHTTIGERNLGWILFHDAVDWFRLLIWRYAP